MLSPNNLAVGAHAKTAFYLYICERLKCHPPILGAAKAAAENPVACFRSRDDKSQTQTTILQSDLEDLQHAILATRAYQCAPSQVLS